MEVKRQKLVRDIITDANKRLNISYVEKTRIPIKQIFTYSTAVIMLVFFFTGSVQAPQGITYVSAQEQKDEATLQAERTELERQLAEYEKQIEETEKTIQEYKKQGSTLKNEISSLNAKIDKLNLKIKAANLTLTKVNQEINNTQKEINRTENKIDQHKKALSEAVRSIYENDNKSLMTIILANDKLSDFFGTINDLELVQEKTRNALKEITGLRQDLLQQKEELSIEKEDAERLRAIQQAQKKDVQSTQAQKSTLLTATKGKESEYQKILKKTQETAAQIRTRIFELLGGGQLTFEKAYDYAKLASGATGVRSAMILAILNQESLLGKNVGRCTYDQIMKGGTTAMSPKQIPTFLTILKELGIDPSSQFAKISCPNQDGTYGGAMGPAQFMPETWKLFSDAISNITNNKPPNPWNNSDAFAGTALYLKKYGADAKTAAAEKKAAAIYYCGTNWKRSSCSYYASRVYDTAENFQDDINTLEGKS